MLRWSLLSPAPVLLALVSIGALAQVNLTVIPQQVNLAAPAGWSTPVTETVSLGVTGENAPFTAAVRYLDTSGGWLSVTPQAGITPAMLTISADASKLTAGRYLGQVTVTAGRVGTYVNVAFTVGAGSGAVLVAEPSGLTFVSRLGAETLQPVSVLVARAGGQTGALSFKAAANSPGNWLTVSPWSANTPAQLTVTATRTPVMTGEYTGAITLTPSNGGSPTVVPVTLLALGSDEAPPSLTLTQRGMTFNYQLGKPAPPLQAIGVSATGGVQQFTAATSTAWLRMVSPVNPTPSTTVTDYAPGLFSVQLEAASLPTGAGPHTGTVSVTAPGLPAQQLVVTLLISAAPALNARPSWLDLDDLSQTEAYIEVTATGSAKLPFIATISPPVSWLTVTPAAATTGDDPPVLHVATTTTSLAAGTYSTMLRLSVLGGGAFIDIPVRLQVSGSVADIPTLKILPAVVDLTGIVGGANPTVSLAVQSSAPGTHRFTAAASSVGGWLTVTPGSSAAPNLIAVGANVAALPGPGEYTGSVIVTSLITGDQNTIPVTLTLSVRDVAAEPGSLSFAQPQNGAAPPAQTVSITAPFPTSFSVFSASSWIRFSPDRAATPATLTVSVDQALVSPGTLNGTIDVVGPNNRLTIPVSLTVPQPEPPAVTPGALTFSYELGNARPPDQIVNIGAGAKPVTFTAAMFSESEVKWLTITPLSGSAPGAITASVDPTVLTPGTYKASILISFAGSSKEIAVPVDLSVSAPKLVVRELLHGAALAPTPVAPGQIVLVTGSGLGPITEVVAQPSPGGVYASQLAGARLLFDGVPAPMLSARNERISAIVPYALHGRTTARVQVEVEGKLSIPIEVKVVDAAPGIFTTGGLGRGSAAALNADLSPNSASNPAARGSVIALFGTGEGQTDPPGQDGRVILTDMRRPLLPVTAFIDGRPADVIYAGSASTMVSGVFQANIRIPEDIAPGVVPLEIRVGNTASTPGITIAVR